MWLLDRAEQENDNARKFHSLVSETEARVCWVRHPHWPEGHIWHQVLVWFPIPKFFSLCSLLKSLHGQVLIWFPIPKLFSWCSLLKSSHWTAFHTACILMGASISWHFVMSSTPTELKSISFQNFKQTKSLVWNNQNLTEWKTHANCLPVPS